ncbi:MAG: DNA-binding response regulator [Candidatus Rokubacteria bacterium RBG_16_73_20]|nr:MAG: DNA-binding response regulator [Candidatus Rokubacteria bacterium GWA2_73_35]OGK89966.1 MAG: DNA-binding response regulator [Candidatus Rokubacteria bacterium RBG_16_73_20]HAM53869.1 DNA-binding response regulator [Candidatus Rokubacteria bacterium]HBH03741.1 DNA-binding response regulator [Candidatus Rokubacteria bacterium]
MRARRVGVLIVDDHEVVRLGLRSLLGREKAIEIVGEAATAEEAVAQAERLRPTVVVMDVRLPDRSGIEACREIRAAAPDTRVIMLTSYADDEAVFASILAGASGYLLKQAGGLDLVRAIERVADGQSLLDPGVTEKVLEKVKRLASGQPDEVTSLSPQEQRVLALVAEGKTNKEIATALGLSDKTVKNYLSNVFDKLHLSRRAEAAAFFARRRPAG